MCKVHTSVHSSQEVHTYGVPIVQYIFIYQENIVHTLHANITLDMFGSRVPPWWRRGVAFVGTNQVYHASRELVIYIVPAQLILGHLALVPVGEHGTISHSLHAYLSAFKRGKCNGRGRPGTGSKLFYINSSAVTWQSDHPLPTKEDY